MKGSTPATLPDDSSNSCTCSAETGKRGRARSQFTAFALRQGRATYCFIWGQAVHAGHNKGCTYKRNLATNSQNRQHNNKQQQTTATTTMTRQRIIQFMRFTSSSSSKLELHQLWLWHLPPSSFVRLLLLLFFLRRKTISIAAAPLPLSKDMPYFRLHNKFANHVLSSSSSSSLGLGHCMPHRHQRRQRQRRAWHQVPVVAIASISAPPPSPACLPAWFFVLCFVVRCVLCVCVARGTLPQHRKN